MIIFLNAGARSVAQSLLTVRSFPSSFLAPVFVPALLLRPCTLVRILRHAVRGTAIPGCTPLPPFPPLCTTRVAIRTEGPPRCRDRLLRRSANSTTPQPHPLPPNQDLSCWGLACAFCRPHSKDLNFQSSWIPTITRLSEYNFLICVCEPNH